MDHFGFRRSSRLQSVQSVAVNPQQQLTRESLAVWDSGLGPTSGGGFHLKKKLKDGGGYETFASTSHPPASVVGHADVAAPSVPAHIVTSAVFAPTLVRMHLKHAEDPIFADGHTHLALLERTLSGNSLDLVGTHSRVSTANSAGPSTLDGFDRSDRNVLVPATTRDGNVIAGVESAEHAIIVVADGQSKLLLRFDTEAQELTLRAVRQTKRASFPSSATRPSRLIFRSTGNAPGTTAVLPPVSAARDRKDGVARARLTATAAGETSAAFLYLYRSLLYKCIYTRTRAISF